jgi:hypothetical protein
MCRRLWAGLVEGQIRRIVRAPIITRFLLCWDHLNFSLGTLQTFIGLTRAAWGLLVFELLCALMR